MIIISVALPIFGVPLNQSVERSRCHDDTGLPLVVRDSIDYLEVSTGTYDFIHRFSAFGDYHYKADLH